MKHLRRTDRGMIAEWWWTVDGWSLAAVGGLALVGIVLSFAGSPAVAERIGFSSFHFVIRHALFLSAGLAVLIAISMMRVRQVLALAVVMLAVSLLALIATPWIGFENKGAIRWIMIGGFSIQPSEFVKPAFAVVAAWLFSEGMRRYGLRAATASAGLLVVILALLVIQPDFGQALLVSIVWGGLFFLAGVPWFWIAFLAAIAMSGAFIAYQLVPHVASRVDRFLDPASGDTYQMDRALDAFQVGGFLGRGPGEGEVKRILPDAHTDFIFSVAAEEFGILFCLAIVALFGFVVVRGFMRTLDERDRFVQLASGGLLTLFGVQALINIGVNVNLLPAKGMTLPFISYGGSSLLATSIAVGMLFALTRRRVGAGAAVRFAPHVAPHVAPHLASQGSGRPGKRRYWGAA